MSDYVLDASLVGKANGNIDNLKPNSVLSRRLKLVRDVVEEKHKIRFNTRLLGEYQRIAQVQRNDWIVLFFEILESKNATLVPRNNLNGTQREKANKCRWPEHDRHLIAAAIGGTQPHIFVTENTLAVCASKVLRHFNVHVSHVV